VFDVTFNHYYNVIASWSLIRNTDQPLTIRGIARYGRLEQSLIAVLHAIAW